MKKTIISLAIVVTGWSLAFTAQAQNALNGAWKIVEIEYRFEGDTLYLSRTQPRNSLNIRTRKLVRLE